MGKQDPYSAAYKADVALAALRGELPLVELADKFRIDLNLVRQWERQAREGLVAVFSDDEPELSARDWSRRKKTPAKENRESKEERHFLSRFREREYG